MEIQQLDILLRLLIAHLLADFVFQTDGIVKRKNSNGFRSGSFYIHLLTVGLLTYVLLAQWANWYAPLVLVIAHGFIDQAKVFVKRDNAFVFVSDQLLHFISIVWVWFWITENTFSDLVVQFFAQHSWNEKYLVIFIAYILLTLPSGVLVGYLTKQWQSDIPKANDESLKNAGKWIGVIERFLILSFILMNQWTPIGFLLAAKSVFRFGDLKGKEDQKKTEYILIGTLMSFSIAIIHGLTLQYLIHNFW
ncbi:MAG: DUF3307 domain-containing protein [Bacteroidales bacterium]|jgi:hypothetical protein|nr:DUF3307 domain-containing protein [Bacteroidales bacterium]